MKTKILITGLGRHGKDALCEILNKKYGMTFLSSSWAMCEEFIFDALKNSHGYKTVQECFDDRHTGNNRELWYNLISDYNKEDKARLAKLILSKTDIYCGLRSKEELDECYKQGVFQLTFWVDALDRVGVTEDESSITVGPGDCHFILDNNGTEKQLEKMADFVWEHVQYTEARRG